MRTTHTALLPCASSPTRLFACLALLPYMAPAEPPRPWAVLWDARSACLTALPGPSDAPGEDGLQLRFDRCRYPTTNDQQFLVSGNWKVNGADV